MEGESKVSGNIVDVLNRRVFGGVVQCREGRIHSIIPDRMTYDRFILPGFIDAHIHIESSMLTPYEFARIALCHGTVATVSDPHEIANVCGLEGVHYMLESARGAHLKFHFGAPSCVPATSFESAGAVLDSKAVESLLVRDDIWYLSEMMNYPGVLHGDVEVMKKIALALQFRKPVDGHAPGLRGADAEKYIRAGITTDHECITKEEAVDKLRFGMKIIIREGSAAKNFEALHELISEHPGQCMLCSDDKHPDDLLLGHINKLASRAVQKGHDVFDVLKCACVNPVIHYKLPVGLLQVNDPADFIVVNDLERFNVQQTWINGQRVYDGGRCILPKRPVALLNNFSARKKSPGDFQIRITGGKIRVIEALDGQLVTNEINADCKTENGYAVPDHENDILKISVVNRYADAKPAVGFIKNFGLKSGAFASTVAHDSHNIIVVGADDESMCKAVNLLIQCQGGLSVVNGDILKTLPLPVAGLMSDCSCEETASAYSELDGMVKKMGCRLRAPFMTLSFMALLVIPDLKLSDQGLFSGKDFRFVNLFEN